MSYTLSAYSALVISAHEHSRNERPKLIASIKSDIERIEDTFKSIAASGNYPQEQIEEVSQRIERLKKIVQ